MLIIPKRKKGITPSHTRSRHQESELADRIGGRRTKASGASYEKGDVRAKGFVRIEAKTTKNNSFSVTTELVDKLESAVLGADEIPILHIELGLGTHKVIVMPDYALDYIIEAMEAVKALKSKAKSDCEGAELRQNVDKG